jgi:hypothetical protein
MGCKFGAAVAVQSKMPAGPGAGGARGGAGRGRRAGAEKNGPKQQFSGGGARRALEQCAPGATSGKLFLKNGFRLWRGPEGRRRRLGRLVLVIQGGGNKRNCVTLDLKKRMCKLCA